MRAKIIKSVRVEYGLGVCLLFAAAAAFGQQAVNLSAGPSTALMPDGNSVPMWGYTCGAPVTGSTATCAALNKSVQAAAVAAAAANQPPPAQWSPVLITIPAGQPLQINLTNDLSFPVGATTPTATIPTSIVIVGQLGGGLGNLPTTTLSPVHPVQGVTWPTVGTAGAPGSAGTFTPPAQEPRVQSFATEVVPGATPAAGQCGSPCTLVWNNLNPGTYLIESGTHPSIQGPMGLYGVLVVTQAPASTNGTETAPGLAYQGATADGVPYDADVPLELSEIDPAQNTAVNTAVNTPGFVETANHELVTQLVLALSNGGTGYTSAPTVTLSAPSAGGTTATATATIDATGAVNSLTLTNAGSGYTSPPTVSFSGGGGAGAAASASLALMADAIASCSGGAAACYPPAVNYTPLYFLINGTAFDRTNAAASLFPTTPAQLLAQGTGGAPPRVLVRLVNAGLRMHTPTIVGAQTQNSPLSGGTAATVGGFSLIAEDGNPLPGLPRIQSEVFMAAGKTYDVMINAPSGNAGTPPPSLAIYDRALAISGNGNQRDTGMLAYIGANGAGTPGASSLGAAIARPDNYAALVNGLPVTVSDPAKGVMANDTNVYGVALTTPPPSNGSVTLNANGTFVYKPGSPSVTSDSFTYIVNGGTTCGATNCATVTLTAGTAESASGITMNNAVYTAATAQQISIDQPGVLASDADAAGYPLTVYAQSVSALSINGSSCTACSLVLDPNGGFHATVPGAGTYTFTYQAQNSQGTLSATPATVTLVFPPGSGLRIAVMDGHDKTKPITDYRWIIEEDQTFYVDPNNTTNAGVSGTSTVPTFGVNFHTSHMPFVAQGCTGTQSCENGQTLGGLPAVCDVGDGSCRKTDANGNALTADNAQQTPLDPSQVVLDPSKRYYISVLPGDAATPFGSGYSGVPCGQAGADQNSCTTGHGMGGAEIAALCTAGSTLCPATYPSTPTIVLSQPSPYQPGKLSVFVFEDDFPLNGEVDSGGGVDVLAPNEPGLGGFNIQLWDAMGGNGDFTGQMTYDMFNQPLSNSLAGTIDPVTGEDACPISVQDGTQPGITGMIVTCPKYEADGKTLSPLAGQAIVANLMPGRFGVVATPGADRIARGEEWHQTNTLDGQKAHDSFIRIGEPSYFQEFGPANYHVTVGFANPAIINGRLPGVCNGSDTNLTLPAGTKCTNTLVGRVTTERMSRTPDERLYSSASHDSFYWTQCYVSVGDPDGEDFAFAKCDDQGRFKLAGLPDGDWRVTVFDQWNDMLVDGLSTPIALSAGNDTKCAANAVDGVTDTNTCDMGDIATNQWQANIYTRTFLDKNESGVSSTADDGVALVPTAVRYRDGSLANGLSTDFTGTANFNETFPLFSWYVVETDTTRYKNTGTHVVYDAGGPADGTLSTCVEGNLPNGTAIYPSGVGYPPCGTSTIGKYLANTIETVSLPLDLRVPGSIYCADADCTGKSMNPTITGGGATNTSDGPSNCTLTSAGNGGGANGTGGAWNCSTELSTGRIDDPWMGGTEGWQGFSGQNNFVEFGKAPYAPGENGGIRGHVVYASTRPFDDPTLLVQTQWEPLVPHVQINLYQEGTGADGRPTLQLVDHTVTSSWDDWAQGFHTGASGSKIPNMNCPGQSTSDLFFFTLANQPNYLDVYGAAHSGGTPTGLPYQAQFKCYDGMHDWNQVQPAPYDGMYSFPSITSTDPATGKPNGTNCTICGKDPAADMYAGVPMLPPGKYVVEVVVPPGFELVKEEDKNILIGDNFIAPATQEFGGLGDIFILPDQASISAEYNANNAQDPTQHLETYQGPSNGFVPGFVPEPIWPCVGDMRIVPDYISLFPWTHQVAPFAGASRPLCDRKEVTLTDQTAATAKFYVYTSAHIASKFTGLITDDFTSEFDPFSPAFGEKFSPPNMPVSFRDWAGNETSRVYSDHWGAFNGLTYSTWEVNPPNPTGYSPTMMVTCMNDPGPIPDPNHPGQTITDPLFNPAYSQFCYELPFMPGQTQYMDTPVVPTAAFAGSGYNNVDCAYPDETPAVKEVDGDVVGPWVGGPKGAVISIALTSGGSNYSSAPTVSLSGGGGSGAKAIANVSLSVVSVSMIMGGAGYTSVPTVVFTGGGGGSGAAGVATISQGVAPLLKITNGGSGYVAAPLVTFSGGGGTGAAARASVLLGRVVAIVVTKSGSGYTSAPTVTIAAPPSGTRATATASLTGVVAAVTVTNGGSGYTSAPIVTFSGGGGSLALAIAGVRGPVQSVSLTSQGTGYTSAPTVAFSGGGGSGAAATATIEAKGTLTITALGDSTVGNYGYSGPSATTAPWNQKSVTRHYGFGNTAGTVSIGGVAVPAANITTWNDTTIVLNVPPGVPACAVQQQAQYGGSQADCGELVITGANGKASIDSVTVTIGGKAPTVLSASDPLTPTGPGAIQRAIDAAQPGDLIIVPAGTYDEMIVMWKPVRLQGVGAASSVINANTQPAGKLDPWRHEVNCLFGLALNGTPISGSNPYDSDNSGLSCPGNGWNGFSGAEQNPQIDRLPLEGIVGWDTTTNGNLAQLLQEPTLMGAYEGAAITVLAKGVNTHGQAGYYGSGNEAAFPTGSTVLTAADCTTGPGGTNPYPSNFQCNPSAVDGLTLTDSSQGGGGIFVHAWAHNLQIANNRVYNNIGTLSGGINVGQGESPDAYLVGTTGNADPGSCETSNITNLQLPYCFDTHVNIHNNYVSMNTSIGDELFSGTPAGAGGVSLCTGADYYLFDYNWVCGNLSTGDGGGVSHLGFIKNGDIEHNAILFNQSTNPTIATNGGGLIIEGAAPDGFTASGIECGGTAADADCAPGLPDGTGQNLVINANLIIGNTAESGSGGGLRLQSVNGTEVAYFPSTPSRWNSVAITNNIIANNVAGWDGGGISLQDAMNAEIVNNTIVSNDTTASSGVLFNTLGAPLASAPGATSQTNGAATSSLPQPAGLVTMPHSTNLAATLPLNSSGQPAITCPSYATGAGGSYTLNCGKVSDPLLENNVFWQNRAFQIGVGALSAQYQQNIVTIYNASFDGASTGAAPLNQATTGQCVSGSSYWDIGVRGDAGPGNHASGDTLAPFYSVLTNASENGNGAKNKLGTNPGEAAVYCNGARTPPEAGGDGGWQVPPGISDATVPNPIFNLSPSATVDEGNNWVNLNWGPLSLVNPQTAATLGNYQLASGSPAIGAGAAPNAPAKDFFGLLRGGSIDIGATEYRTTNPPIP